MFKKKQFQFMNLAGTVLHPETQKAIETVHYHVEHNIPIRKELLYEVAPELFETEIEQLDKIERDKILAKRPSLSTVFQITIILQKNIILQGDQGILRVQEFPLNKQVKNLHYYEQLRASEYEMEELLYRRMEEVSMKWDSYFEMKVQQGYATYEAALIHLINKPQEKRTQDENLIYDDVEKLRKMNEDYQEFIKQNKIRIFKKQRELQIPKFVENNEKLKQFWIKRWEEIVSNSTLIDEAIFLPEADVKESQIDQALKKQKNLDIESLLKESQLEFQQKMGGDEPIRGRDRINKDESLVKKLNILSNAMNDVTIEQEQEVKHRIQFRGPLGLLEAPEEQKITIIELPKILYLNNKDSKQYNLQFWSTHFNIEPQKLRNIFNFVSYAIPDLTNEKETGRILRFIYE